MLDESVRYVMWGFLYKFILAHVLGETLLPPLKNLALQSGGFFNLYALAVMYTFGLELFFDFAGYSMFALAISNLMGIRSPINFNKPFLSRDLKEFWNRWHMSLSFWFRDFVFMRMVMVLTRKKVAMRIRTFEDWAELTLKVPQSVGNMEYNQKLQLKDAENYLSKEELPQGLVVF
ncbi:transport protein DltB [Streptococcus pneumoniae]|nr:transport protein DltB [Streptococcus pneumoniae]